MAEVKLQTAVRGQSEASQKPVGGQSELWPTIKIDFDCCAFDYYVRHARQILILENEISSLFDVNTFTDHVI